MAQQLSALGSVTSTYIMTHNPLELQVQEIQHPLLASLGTIYMLCKRIFACKTLMHIKALKIKIKANRLRHKFCKCVHGILYEIPK